MSPISPQETIEDHIFMAFAYGAHMGDPAALDEAEAVIIERRGTVVDGQGVTTVDYSRRTREAVTVLFMNRTCRTQADFSQAAVDLELGWREILKGLS